MAGWRVRHARDSNCPPDERPRGRRPERVSVTAAKFHLPGPRGGPVHSFSVLPAPCCLPMLGDIRCEISPGRCSIRPGDPGLGNFLAPSRLPPLFAVFLKTPLWVTYACHQRGRRGVKNGKNIPGVPLAAVPFRLSPGMLALSHLVGDDLGDAQWGGIPFNWFEKG